MNVWTISLYITNVLLYLKFVHFNFCLFALHYISLSWPVFYFRSKITMNFSYFN